MPTGRAILSATLCAAALAGAEPGTAPPAPLRPQVVAGTVPIVPQVGDLAQVAKVRFYVSSNQGATWTLAHEAEVAAGATAAPRFEFKAPADGTYHFATAAVFRTGQAEPEPPRGQLPPHALAVTVDTTPPVVGDLQATADTVADASVVLGVTWSVSDTNFSAATLQVSGDGGRSFMEFPQVQPRDYARINVPRTIATTGYIVRLVARDLAGNTAASQPRQVALPANPEQKLAAALGGLPTLADVQPVVRPEEPAAATAARPEEPRGAEERRAAEEPRTEPVGRGAEEPAAGPGRAVPEPVGERPEAAPERVPGVIAPAATSRNVATPGGLYLRGEAAATRLEQARNLAAAGDTDRAHEAYLRLLESDRAQVAAEEDLSLLRGAGDLAAVVGVAGNLPPVLRSDAVRLEWGRALIGLGRHAEAVAQLERVARLSAEARPALLLIGQAREAQGRRGEALRIYDHLAQGDDAAAQEARLLRGR